MSSFHTWPTKTKGQRARKKLMLKREMARRKYLLKVRKLMLEKYLLRIFWFIGIRIPYEYFQMTLRNYSMF